MLRDRFGRPLTHVRISVTNSCNYSCVFCHREGFPGSSGNELSPEDWDFFIGVATRLGLRYYKFTGGEPLLYRGIVEVVESVRRHGGVPSITTNGYLLKELAGPLSRAGVDHINVSLHSLRREVYSAITGSDSLERVLEGIREALRHGIRLKINYLAMRANLAEARSIIGFASTNGADVNLIELVPLGMDGGLYEELHADLDDVVGYLEAVSVEKRVEPFQNRTVYVLPSGTKVYVVRGYGNPLLCSGCTRIRLGPDGKLKLCLYRDGVYLDLGPLIRARDEDGVRRAIMKAAELREPYFRVGPRAPG